MVQDRLGSTVKHFPCGEEPTTTAQNETKFATYFHDATTAPDYAQQRCYARTIGRFTSPDPCAGSARLANRQSWNRYTYVGNDPVNLNDPEGLFWRELVDNTGGALNSFLEGVVSAGSFFGDSVTWTVSALVGHTSYDNPIRIIEEKCSQNPEACGLNYSTQVILTVPKLESEGVITMVFDPIVKPFPAPSPKTETPPVVEKPLFPIPLSVSVVIPYSEVPVFGGQVSFAYIPNTPQGEKGCLGLGAAVGAPVALGLSVGPLIVGEGTDVESVVGRWGGRRPSWRTVSASS